MFYRPSLGNNTLRERIECILAEGITEKVPQALSNAGTGKEGTFSPLS
jgi:hypothetical protein